MQIETAQSLQEKFKAGLTICGENLEGQLEWIGSVKQWNQAKQNHLDPVEVDYRDFEGEYTAVTPDKL